MVNSIINILILMLTAVAVFTDVKSRIIPNGVCLSVLACGIVRYIFEKEAVMDGICGFAAAVLIMFLCRLISKNNIGAGDIKLICAMGFSMGLKDFIESLFITAFTSFAVTLILLLSKRIKKEDSMPFAPFVFAGVLGGIIL